MSEQLLLPSLECNSAINILFFALLVNAENASQIVQLRERLCAENGLRGQRIATDLLHITLHGIGAYDGLPGGVVERAKDAGAAISAKPFDIVLDRATSFYRKRVGRPFVLRATDELALITFYQLLGRAMKNVGFRKVASQFNPHLTLLYGHRMVAERSIEAFRWKVRDFVLVQSLRGRGESKYMARWRLRG